MWCILVMSVHWMLNNTDIWSVCWNYETMQFDIVFVSVIWLCLSQFWKVSWDRCTIQYVKFWFVKTCTVISYSRYTTAVVVHIYSKYNIYWTKDLCCNSLKEEWKQMFSFSPFWASCNLGDTLAQIFIYVMKLYI